MKSRHSAHGFRAPRHLDRPKQWVHAPWLLLGMLFITALLVASQRVSSIESGTDDGTPAGSSSQEP